jgi:hypothetical protein
MPDESKLSPEIDNLIASAARGGALDTSRAFNRITKGLEVESFLPIQKKVRQMLREHRELSTEGALLMAGILHYTGFPPQRLLRYLSLYLPGTLNIDQFQFIVGVIFNSLSPLSDSLLFDMTSYTYLLKERLVKKSLEISKALQPTLNPRIILYLYLLFLREDLSNENVELIMLVLEDCSPKLKTRERRDRVSLDEYREIEDAYRKAGEKKSLPGMRGESAASPGAKKAARDSASFFLDKYFSDAELERQNQLIAAAIKRTDTAKKKTSSVAAGLGTAVMDLAETGKSAEPARLEERPGVETPARVSRQSASAGLMGERREKLSQEPPALQSPKPRKKGEKRSAPTPVDIAASGPALESTEPAPVGIVSAKPVTEKTGKAVPFEIVSVGPAPDRYGKLVIPEVKATKTPVRKRGTSAAEGAPTLKKTQKAPAPRREQNQRTELASDSSGAHPAKESGAEAARPDRRESLLRGILSKLNVRFPARPRRSSLLWIAGICLVVLIALGAIFVFRPRSQQPPSRQAPVPTPVEIAPSTSYTVRSGDNLWKIYSILKTNGMIRETWREFLEAVPSENGITNPDRIYPGKELSY